MPASKPGQADTQIARSQLRLHAEGSSIEWRQKLLPLDWFDVRTSQDDEPQAQENIATQAGPDEAVMITIPAGRASNVIHCTWQIGHHRHPGRCIPVAAPEGYEACILIVPEESRPLVFPALGLE